MVKIRMARHGRHKNPFYHIVAADSRFSRDGRYSEKIGTFDPKTKKIDINNDLAIKWIKFGAVPTNSVKNLFKKYGLFKNKKNGD